MRVYCTAASRENMRITKLIGIIAATLVGIDSATDLALFRLADEAAVAPATLGDAAGVQAGHLAIAVGRSGEGDLIASSGVVPVLLRRSR